MKTVSLFSFFVLIFISNHAFSQAKFQNNRFQNLKAVPVKIKTTDDFYMVFDFTENEDKQLSKLFSKDDYAYVKLMTDQENYPDSLKTMELQTANFDKLKNAKAYKIAEFDYASSPTVILCVPVSENADLKKQGLIDDKDLILVCDKKDIQ